MVSLNNITIKIQAKNNILAMLIDGILQSRFRDCSFLFSSILISKFINDWKVFIMKVLGGLVVSRVLL